MTGTDYDPPPATTLVVPAELDGERLDVALTRLLPDETRSRIQRHIEAGTVRLRGAAPKRGSKTPVHTGDVVEWTRPPPEAWTLEPEPVPLSIVYEDDDLLVIDKAAGTVVHPAPGHLHGTIVHGVLHHVGQALSAGPRERPGIVHRLDRDTTGVLLIAKNERSHAALSEQFAHRQVLKTYAAVALGTPPARRIETPHGRDPKDRKKFSSRVAHGKRAISVVHVERSWGAASHLRVDIETGRTHQIRVHLADLGHPLVGDATYGGRRLARAAARDPRLVFDRPALHAARLELKHPVSGGTMVFTAPVPDDLRGLMARFSAAEEQR